MSPDMEEAELIGRCLEGDEGALGEVIGLYQDRLYGFALRLLKNPQDAEDAAQDAFVRAFRNLASYDKSRPFSTWLFTIAHNRCMDLLRARRPDISIDEEAGAAAADAAASAPDHGPLAFETALVEKALASLPPIYAEILLLQYKEDLDGAELAAVLGVPEGTVKARLSRARAMMRGKLMQPNGSAGRITCGDLK